jgi:hypothetical protein
MSSASIVWANAAATVAMSLDLIFRFVPAISFPPLRGAPIRGAATLHKGSGSQLRRPAVLKGRREFFDALPKLEGLSVKPAIMAFVHAFISYRAKAAHRQFESVRRVNDVVELELQIGRDGWGIHSGSVWKSRRVAQTARRGAH